MPEVVSPYRETEPYDEDCVHVVGLGHKARFHKAEADLKGPWSRFNPEVGRWRPKKPESPRKKWAADPKTAEKVQGKWD